MENQNQSGNDIVLVIGGAGYIGSHTVDALLSSGHRVVVLDDFSTGHRDAIDARAVVEQGDCGDPECLTRVFSSHDVAAVIHFASRIEAGISVEDPAAFYHRNVANTIHVLSAMSTHAVKALVFSSSAGVYGDPQRLPVDEDHPKNPVSPYARSKWLIEQLLPDYDHAYGLKSCALRYFNAAGADPLARYGERHEPETHLIPLLLRAILEGQTFSIFGNDYPTADGTCVRDYVHVSDLARAHVKAVQYLLDGGSSVALNIGTGRGHSNQQVIDCAQRVTGLAAKVQVAARRSGDPAELVADSTRAQRVLNWMPQYDDLETMVQHAWAFETDRMRVLKK
jgi:UDP-glucose 4-epimerase